MLALASHPAERLGPHLLLAGVLVAAVAVLAGLWVPRPALRSIRIDDRFATKFMPGTGLLVIGWEAHTRQYESGFRAAASRYEEVVAAVRGLLANDTDPAKVTEPMRGEGAWA